MDFNIILYNIDFLEQTKRKINEEETKMYLLFPFLEYLGYSVFSPSEIVFEYVCDMHENGSRRVDCAILKDGNPVIIIEAKSFGEELSGHWGQIKSYFISSGANYAILTNGLLYHVFEKEQIDSNYSNCAPKYEFEIDKLTEEDYTIIKLLSKMNIKPFLSPTNDLFNNKSTISTFLSEEEKSLRRFCSTITKNNVVNTTVNDLYNRYIDYCNDKNLPIYAKIAFSKKIANFFSVTAKSKRIGGNVHRVYF